MKKSKHSNVSSILRSFSLSLSLSISAGCIQAETIFSEDFTGTSEDLDGSAPDIRPGTETWIAGPVFNQDGSLDPDPSSATLAFTPVDGNVYQLEVSVRDLEGNQNWIALGYGAGQSAAITAGNRFINDLLIGKAWMLCRGNADGNQAFLGTDISGTQNGSSWNELLNETGDIDLRIELDTRWGAGTWAATFFAKKPADLVYRIVREKGILVDEMINSVGIAVANTGIEGRIESFTLSNANNSGPILVTDVVYSASEKMVTLSWTSSPGEVFALKYSSNMTNWTNELEDSISAGDGTETTRSFDVTDLAIGGKLFFRVEKQ